MTEHAPACRGRTLKLYLVDGTPSGVITAELGVSSVRAAVASRTALPELIRREEAARTGIYLLVGPDPDVPGRQLVYVGEGDQVKTRLVAHDGDEAKEFFTRAVLIVSKDENLTKAHGRYLEGRIIAAIRGAGRAKLVNGTEPPFRGLPEPEIADMERVLDEIEVLLPVLGFDVLRPAGQEAGAARVAETGTVAVQSESAVFVVTLDGTQARAREASDEFVVLAGSTAKAQEVPSCSEGLQRRRAQLVADGVLVPTTDAKFWRFAADTAFDSPSGAAGIVYGGNVS
ncbi:MAG: GIY-YIG nuclease family protein, partial [Beijerinckiaceae bacterium]